MTENYYALIMAGGGGTRLWPLSRKASPKQTLRLVGDRTLFQVAVDRLKPLFPADKILVVTTAEQANTLQEQYPELPKENFILEPAPRGTASAIGLGAVVLQKRDPTATMAVLTADHFIEHQDRFLQVLKAAQQTAQTGFLVTLGIHPIYPATGFGYIRQGHYLETFEDLDVFNAEQFTEKPDEATAREMLAGEDHSWNSGMFIWTVDNIMTEFKRQMPDLHHALENIKSAWDNGERDRIVADNWMPLKSETIDYGIMEGAEKVAVVPAKGLGWSDVGSWETLFDVLETDNAGNIIECQEYININSKNNLIRTNGEGKRMYVTIGVEDLVVVDTGDVVLICNRQQAQDVKQVVNLLKEQNKQEYL